MIEYEYNGDTFKIIPLDEMEIGIYKGHCRNATYAYWNGVKFIHLRTKFHDTFLEAIEHPENEYRFDVFMPFEVADPEDNEVKQLMNAINENLIRKMYDD